MKLLTGYALYSIPGRDYTLRTIFNINDDKIHVSGDPTPLLTLEDLYKISENLRGKQKINSVEFEKIFDNNYYGRGWSMDDVKFCYSQKIEPYTVNEGCIYDNYMPESHEFHNPHDSNMFPYNAHRKLFSDFLIYNVNNSNNSINDNIIYGMDIKKILKHMEVMSYNFSAEVMFKYLSYVKNGTGISSESSKIIKNFIEKFYGKNDLYIADGSGLSRLNLINTLFLSEFVNKIYRQDDGFLQLLPDSRTGNGTLKNRFTDIKNYTIRAKTGTLDHCSLLSGIIEDKNISFSISINNSNLSENEGELKIDKLLKYRIDKL